jgi:hypothetical protein
MAVLRRQLRFFSALWVVVQMGMVMALVPLGCCRADREASARVAERSDHDQATRCPHAMSASVCPMHHGHKSAAAPLDGCSMRAKCDGPTIAVVDLLSFNAVMSESPAVHPDSLSAGVVLQSAQRPTAELAPPESPPPRT